MWNIFLPCTHCTIKIFCGSSVNCRWNGFFLISWEWFSTMNSNVVVAIFTSRGSNYENISTWTFPVFGLMFKMSSYFEYIFFLSVQRTVIAQMIPVSITYQFCKNKFVSKMIIYVNFNFVIMLTIIMMIMIFVFYTATYFLRQEFVLRMSYRNGRRSLSVKSKALTKSLSLYFSESTWRKQSLHNLTIFRK